MKRSEIGVHSMIVILKKLVCKFCEEGEKERREGAGRGKWSSSYTNIQRAIKGGAFIVDLGLYIYIYILLLLCACHVMASHSDK